jgi:tRNA(His) 5'-end guanylyltransferase
MSVKLSHQIDSFIERTNYKLLNKLPIVITVNGRGFSKLSALLEKPYSDKLAECFYSVLIKLVQEIDGAVFGYTFNDEIIIISRNDQNDGTVPWYDNNIQKIVSVVSSLATLQFNNCALALDLNLMGEAVFYTNVYAVPTVSDAINVILHKQQQSLSNSIYHACLYELLNKFDKNHIKEILAGTTIDDKINLLQQECGIDYHDYPAAFRRGAACYRSPKVVKFEGETLIKNKWTLNDDLPIFTKDHVFFEIIRNGIDVVRNIE